MAGMKLPKEMITELRRHERALHDLLPEYDKAEACGADCQELRNAHKEWQDKISAMLQHYA